jgi:hypothetical protein
MCSNIVREGCREAELRGMLAVEAIEGAWSPLFSLAVVVGCCRWLFVAQPAHAACQPR